MPRTAISNPNRANATPTLKIAPKKFYRPELDGFRALAFLLVCFSHFDSQWTQLLPMPLSKMMNGVILFGWVGVSLFFALSGFLTTSILLGEQGAKGEFSIPKFYFRRCLRICPLYYAFLFATFLVVPWIGFGDLTWGGAVQLNTWREYGFGLLTFLQNFYFGAKGYSEIHFLNPLWSIAAEMHFYLVWPLILRRFKTPASLLRVSLALVVLSPFVKLLLSLNHTAHFVWLNSLTHFDTFIYGSIFAQLHHSYSKEMLSRDFSKLAASLLGLPIILAWFGWSQTSPGFRGPVFFFLIGLAVPGAFYLVLMRKEIQKFLSLGWLVWLGKVSYGLYVFHLLARDVATATIHKIATGWATEYLSLSIVPTTLLITVALATVSFYGFERRFLELKMKRY